MNSPVGIAVLTNANRCEYLKNTIESFLENCSYRPLVFGIFDNFSTDNTPIYLKNLPQIEGVEWRIKSSDIDLGCGAGVNRANEIVREFEYTFFLESDWLHLSEKESGVGKNWMQEGIDFIKTGKCDYLYYRRFKNQDEAQFHDWQWVVSNCQQQEGQFLYTERFMYSNNPHLRRTQSLYDNGTLPLTEFFSPDGKALENKENKAIWGKAEHAAKHPKKLWIHVWGMFHHEAKPYPDNNLKQTGCGKYGPYGCSTCKYGFTNFRNGWCALCDANKDYKDMYTHTQRFRNYFATMLGMRQKILPCVDDMEYNPGNVRA